MDFLLIYVEVAGAYLLADSMLRSLEHSSRGEPFEKGFE
ncbi:hypothetical protein J514_1294 [Acinetobacter sp. 1396970]|nr:hypothetical protein J514_1294 [Acinetobacter sp. 1396970]